MRRIAVINQKGGVGKTTTAVNLGAALAHLGRRVCLVDVDAQANLSLHLDIESASGTPSTYTVLTGATSLDDAVRPTSTPGLVVVPSNLDLSGAELELASAIGRESLLRDAIDTWKKEHERTDGRAPADYVIFDCPPSLGLLSVNALAGADEVVLTLQTEFFALQGMSKLVEVVQILRRRLNPGLVISGILPCLYDSRLRLAREVLGEIRSYFPGEVFRHPIRTNVKLAEAPSYGQTIFEYAPESNGARDYLSVAREVIAKESRDPDLAGLPAPPDARAVLQALRRSPASAPAPTASDETRQEDRPSAAPTKDLAKDLAKDPALPAKTSEATTPEPEPEASAPPVELREVVLQPQPRTPAEPEPLPERAEPESSVAPETTETTEPTAASPEPAPIPTPATLERTEPEPPATSSAAPVPEDRARPDSTRRIVRARDLPPLPADAFDSLTSYLRDPS